MRIGIDARWITPESSGIGVYTRELIGHLALLDRENEYTLLFCDRRLRDSAVAEMDLQTRDNFGSCVLPYGIYGVRNQLLLPSVIRGLSLDVFHSTNYMVPLLAFPRDRAGQTKCVVTVHDMVPLALPDFSPKSKKARLLPIHKMLMLEIGRRADMLVVDSEASRSDAVRFLRVPQSRAEMVRVLYCGVSSRFGPKSMQVGARREENRARVVLYVGRSDPYKGVVSLVEALDRLLAMCPFPVRLRIVGRRDERYPEAYKRAQELGIDEFVEWTGFLPDDVLVAAYQEADVLALPSRCEGFGLPVLEAMACGTPVVCSNRGALPEVAGDAAKYVEPDNSDELAQELYQVLSDPGLREQMVVRGIRRAQFFTWERAAKQTLAIYRDVLDR